MTLSISHHLTRRTIIIILVILLFATCLIIFFISHPKEQVTTTVPRNFDKSVDRVFIKDLHKYSEYFTTEDQHAIENTLYIYASRRGEIPDLYTGTIRPNSLLQSKTTGDTISSKIIVDVSPVSVTYILSITGTIHDGPRPISIQCAPQDQQKNPSIPCLDGMKNRE